MGTRGTRGTNYFSQEINKLQREGDAPERALIELAKNNLSHPSHPSHLAPLDVIWSIPGCQRDAKPSPAPSLPKERSSSKRGTGSWSHQGSTPGPKPALERGIRPLIEFASDGRPRQNRGRSAPRTSADIKEPISASLQRPPPRGAKGRRKKTRKGGIFGETKPLCCVESAT